MTKSTNRIIERLEILGDISDDEACLSRFYGTAAHKKAGEVLLKWMTDAGMEATRDAVGNIHGVLDSGNPNAKCFMIGSHYDSVHNAGKYDGPLGVILGIEVVQMITDKKINLPFDLHVCAFADEEGCRFNIAYLGSSQIAGNFDKNWLTKQDDSGNTLGNLIEQNGGTLSTINKNTIPGKDWIGYLEAHIEQGPVLCDEDIAVGLVTGIAAQTRINVLWKGISGHAGTYPMELRNDALCAAAEFILTIEAIGNRNKDKLVATVGKLNVNPNISNVIPGAVSHSIDVRSSDDKLLKETTKTLHDKALQIAKKRNINFEWEIMQSNPSVLCDKTLKEVLGKTIIKHTQKIIEIPSGAGHDAVMIAKVAPVSMLFIRCKEGISHHPDEYVAPKDISQSLQVCNDFITALAKIHEQN